MLNYVKKACFKRAYGKHNEDRNMKGVVNNRLLMLNAENAEETKLLWRVRRRV